MSTVEEAKKRKHCTGREILMKTIPSCVIRIQLHIMSLKDKEKDCDDSTR